MKLLKLYFSVLVLFFLSSLPLSADSVDTLKQGLLGGASGAVGGVASGAKSGELWKGALAGAATNVVGGALLDTISNKPQSQTAELRKEDFQCRQEKILYVDRPIEKVVYVDREPRDYKSRIERIRQEGFNDGYRQAMSEIIQYCKGRL